MARVAFIVGEMFEDSEFRVPFDRVRESGHEAVVIGVQANTPLRGKRGRESVTPTVAADQVKAEQFDALVIPGGYSPDHLRLSIKMVGFTRDFFMQNKPVAAICHAGWMLVEADVLEGRTVTSWPSIKTDLINAGARWVDREVVEDGCLITSRRPDDLPAFCSALLKRLKALAAQQTAGAAAGQSPTEPPAPVH